MALQPVALAPPNYALQSPRPDLKQAAGSAALTLVDPVGMTAPATPNADLDFKRIHTRLVEDFEAAEDASRTSREKAERDVDYYDAKQLTDKQVKELEDRGQPPVVLNMIRQKVDFLLGLEREQRTKPRALPRTQMHEKDAAAVGDALRFVVEDNRYDQTRSRVWKDIICVGWGGIELSTEERQSTSGAPATRIIGKRCPWDRMFWDPFSSEDDFADAQYLGLVLWMDRTDAVRLYGRDAGKVFDETVSGAAVGGTLDDKPKLTTWVQLGKRQRVRIVQMYRISDDTGEWEYWEFTKGGILKGGPSPWVDAQGAPVHPYEWTSAYVDRDNNRYGAIRDLIDPQDELNKRRSKALHLYTMRQTFGTPDGEGGMSVNERRRQLARPDGHVQLPPGAKWGENFGLIPTGDMAAGQIELLSHVMGVFQNMGPNAAMQGKGPQSASGRAVLANQQGGVIALGPLTDNLRDMDHRIYRKMWNAIRQFWTGETWIRVTDDEKNLKWVGLNTPKMVPLMQPVLIQGPQGPQVGQQPAIGPDGQPLQQPVIDPRTGQPILQNDVSEIEVDIFIDDAPDVGTLLDEQFEKLVTLKQLDVKGEIPFETVIEAFPGLRNKDRMLEQMRERGKMLEAQEQQQAPVREAMIAAELDDKQAGAAQKKALAAKAMADAVGRHAEMMGPQELMGMEPGGYPAGPPQQQLPPQGY